MFERWKPQQVLRGDWGTIKVFLDGVDSTYVRGAPVILGEWSSGDPFDDASCAITLPQVTSFDELGKNDLKHIREWCPIDIILVRPNGSRKVLWEGFFVSYSFSQGQLVMHGLGALYQADFYAKQPRFYADEKPMEALIAWAFTGGIPMRVEWPEGWDKKDDAGQLWTGHKTRYSGAWEKVLTGYIQDILALMLTDDGRAQWTLMKNTGRKPRLRLKDIEPLDHEWSISVGQRGVEEHLTRDYSQAVNVIYGEGQDDFGGLWRNAFFNASGNATYYDPLAQDPEALDRWQVGEKMRVEAFYKFYGTQEEGFRDARMLMERDKDPGWVGDIILTADPEEGSRFEMKAGERILLKNFKRGPISPNIAYEALYRLGIFTSNDRLEPINRGQMASVLVRMLEHTTGSTMPVPSGGDQYSDIAGSSHRTAINKLSGAGILLGFEDGTFQPERNLTRAQMASVIVRAAEWGLGTSLPPGTEDYFFDDNGSTHEPNINKAQRAGLIQGYGDRRFGPNDTFMRLHAAYFTWRLNRVLGGDILAEAEESTIFHIAEVIHSPQDGKTALKVDTKSRDLLTLSEIEQRTRDSRTPHRLLQVGQQSLVFEERFQPWDATAGAGFIPTAAKNLGLLNFKADDPRARYPYESFTRANPPSAFLSRPVSQRPYVFVNGSNPDKAKRWSFTTILVSEDVNIRISELTAYDVNGRVIPADFHWSIYEMPEGSLDAYEMPWDEENGDPDPFAPHAFDRSWLGPNPDDPKYPASEDVWHLGAPELIIGWGDGDQKAGYWPGLESKGSPRTGMFRDEGGWQHRMHRGYYHVTVAIYCTRDAYFMGRLHRGFTGVTW